MRIKWKWCKIDYSQGFLLEDIFIRVSCKSPNYSPEYILTHPPLVLNSNVSQTFSQKHPGAILHFKNIPFQEHLNNVLAKINTVVGLLHKLRNLFHSATSGW